MTRDVSRLASDGQIDNGVDADVLAGLWQEAPFARLPADAPPELKALVQDIENPKRVYAVHRASRRHQFQALVERYVVQLRNGCGSSSCVTPTCFSCRKRLAGKSPLRKYNTTSARTLAIYLASQDNPDSGLCPHLRLSRDPPAALNSLLFAATSSTRHETPDTLFPKRASHNPFTDGQKRKSSGSPGPAVSAAETAHRQSESDGHDRKGEPQPHRKAQFDARTGTAQASIKVSERHLSKDHRSFAANIFGTVAFKMLEWITPTSLDSMSKKVLELQGEKPSKEAETKDARDAAPEPRSPESLTTDPASRQDERQEVAAEVAPRAPPAQPIAELGKDDPIKPISGNSKPEVPNTAVKPGKPRRSSSARVRATSSTKPSRKLSMDTFQPAAFPDDIPLGLISPRLNSAQPEKTPRLGKNAHGAKSRAIPEIPSTPSFFDNVPSQQPPLAPSVIDLPLLQEASQLEPEAPAQSAMPQAPQKVEEEGVTDERKTEQGSQEGSTEDESLLDLTVLPQSLEVLSAEVVDFLCDILQEDGTLETHMLHPQQITREHLEPRSAAPMFHRLPLKRSPYPKRLRKQWKLFIEQSLFNVLSDPQRLVESFVKDGEFFDSHSLWYCLLRLTRVAPSLVLHSLWMSAASLFVAPKALHSLRSPTAPVFRKAEQSLSATDAGRLMSICLHALVAASPLVQDSRTLVDMSRIRAHGLTLAGNAAVARQPALLCLQYEDAFSDDLALRLARRLFSAISARHCFAEMVQQDETLEGTADDLDVLQPLLSQLYSLHSDSGAVLRFSPAEHAVHETRVTTLLLDWARTVMLQDWDGRPEVSSDRPFGGALLLLGAMHRRRQSLMLGDVLFRVDYFADRLDSITMPVAWLSHNSTKQKAHLLDFPYMFNPPTLVSYFRSINFSHMSRCYEESSSLQTRMKAIMARRGLITNINHKAVLQDLLRTASSKYLILSISRENVIRDALDQLWKREDRELHRPLKVHLGEDGGEEGFDSGGVQQEFFRLAVAECLDPDYGAFTVDERTRMTWFVPGSIVPLWKYEMLGLLVSLAVYNGLTLPVTFPNALYRKLLGEPVNELFHIEDGWPDLASGLTQLLEWDEFDGLVEDVFARTYEFSVATFGQPISREMKAEDASWPQFSKTAEESLATGNPADAPLVTNENRNAYVSDYIRYLTDVAVRPQYEAFAKGFRTCLHPKSLQLLSPGLLQTIVEGVQEIDIADLRRYTRYVGWDASHRSIRDFWSIVKRYDERMKRKLLEFVTASDRVPVGGMKNLQFVLQRNGDEEGERGHLPTAYTCYGTLLLPEYRDKEVLRERLAMALENAQGFGFA